MGLKSKTVKGLGWSFADIIANQGLRFLVGLIIARLVTPHDYGLIGITLIFITIFEDVVDGGFTNALIQKKEPTEKDYSTAFITNLVFSACIYVLLFFTAPYITLFFHHEHVITQLVRVVSVILLIDALMFVPRAKLTKSMNFKTQTKISLVSSVIAGVIGITMATIGMGVWALACQQLVRHGCNTILFWIVIRGDVFHGFSSKSFHSLFSFGSKLLLSDFSISVYNQLYRIVIGKCYSPATLGQYTRADQFSVLLSVTFTQVLQKVSFPALSSIQDDDNKLLEASHMLIKYASFIVFSCMFCLVATAKPMILFLLGNQWQEAVPYLQIMGLGMMLYPLQVINLNILKVKGRSDQILKLEIIKRIIGIIPLLLGIFYSIYWMLWGSVMVGVVGYFLDSHYASRLIEYSLFQQIKDITPSFLVALTTASVLFMMSFLPLSPFILFPLQLITGVILIYTLSLLFHLESLKGIISLLCTLRNRNTK